MMRTKLRDIVRVLCSRVIHIVAPERAILDVGRPDSTFPHLADVENTGGVMTLDRAAAHWDEHYSGSGQSRWTTNSLVLAEVFRRMTGTEKFWLNWAFEDYVKKPLGRVLSIGCGDGSHELIIARNKYAAHIDAFDASPEGIRRGQETAKKEGLNINFYVGTFEQYAAAPVSERYDLVMFAGSLHHVRDIEGVLDKTRRVLNGSGQILFNEYVGPIYNIYPRHQVCLVNKLLSAIAPEFKTRPDANWVNPTIETVLATDPSESVRAPLVIPLLEVYFDVTWKRYFGGALLHMIFNFLNLERLNDGTPESESIVRLLIEAENALTEAGALGHDFCWGFCELRS